MDLTSALLSIAIGLCSIFLYFYYRRLNYWKLRGIPHDKPHIIQGNLKGVGREFHEQDIYRNYYKKYKGKAPFVGFYFFQAPMAFVTDLDLVKSILIKDFNNFADRPTYYNEKDDPLTAHLFSLKNPKWKELRQKLSPTFTSGKMKYMFPTLKSIGDKFVEVIKKQSEEQEAVDVKDMFARFTTDIIGSCAFGIECNSLVDVNAEFRTYGRRFFEEVNQNNLKFGFGVAFPKFANKLGITIFPKSISDFFMNAIGDTVAYREKNNVQRNDFMDILINLKNQSKDNISLNELAAQAFVFYLAGFETSSTVSSYALYEMALNPEIQAKARAEVEEVLKKYNNEFTYESLLEMKYLDQIIWGK